MVPESALKHINAAWMRVLYSEEEIDGSTSKQLLHQVCARIEKKEGTLKNTCPPPKQWFEFARLTKYQEIRVVIIGQDPYYTEGTAHGLAFSCTGSVPPSLRNIYKCLKNTGCIDELPESADLTKWAKQGVLLINGALSTRLGKAKVHAKAWEPYVDLLIERISQDFEKDGKKLIFMLWGAFAQEYKELISDYHHVWKWAHPSPMAQGSLPAKKKFINCNHFVKANKIDPIDWSVDDSDSESSDSDDDPPNNTPYQDWYEPSYFKSDGCRHVVFTDGSCEPNNKSPASVGGYAAVFVDGKFRDTILMGNLCTDTYYASNIRAEGMAINDAFDSMLSDKRFKSGIILTDCKLWINMLINWMPNWDEDKFKEMENYDITSDLWSKWCQLKRKGTIDIIHVPAHNKKKWLDEPSGTYKRYCGEENKFADALANYARLNMPRNTKKQVPVEYED